MGQCCTRPDLLDNEEAIFMNLIISSLKITSEDYSKIEKKFDACLETKIEQEGNIEQQIVLISENLYMEFIEKNFYSNDSFLNHYLEFHKNIFPNFEEITNENLFEFNFHRYCFSLYLNTNKYELLYKMLTYYIYVDTIYFHVFEDFIFNYLKINLVTLTKKINSGLHKTKEESLVDGYKINKEFREKMDFLEKNVFNEYNLNIFKEEIVQIMKKIVLKNYTNKTDFGNILITLDHLKIFNESYPHLFDCVKLRECFLSKFVEKK